MWKGWHSKQSRHDAGIFLNDRPGLFRKDFVQPLQHHDPVIICNFLRLLSHNRSERTLQVMPRFEVLFPRFPGSWTVSAHQHTGAKCDEVLAKIWKIQKRFD